MARIEARELVAYGLECDNIPCETIIPTRNSLSRPEGFYLDMEKITEAGKSYKNKDLFFCQKECLVEAMRWQLSSLLT